jgi:prepilin-type N-terminal cleavage/methylation domain-containing protein
MIPAEICKLNKKDGAGRNQRARRGGFTLIEILVAMAIMMIIMAMIIFPFISSTGYVAKARARSEAQQAARDALDTMSRELGEAMEIYLLPADPSLCAFVPPRPNTYPLRPSDNVVRYWLVWRSDPNANNSGVIPSDSPVGKSWYERFSSNPRLNRATSSDDDARYIARTVFNRANAGPPADPLYPNGITDPDALNRALPAKSAPSNSIVDKQNFVAITPDETNFDIPVLRFTATPQVNETLQRDNSGVYVFRSKYPLWESNWSIAVYTSGGGAVISPFTAAAIPSGVAVDPYGGKVSFVKNIAIAPSINANSYTLASVPVVPGSETIVVGGEPYTRVDANPGGNQYTISYSTGALLFGATIAAADITYQQPIIAATDLVVASYATRALLNITVTASKRDTQSGVPQTVSLQQKVKLKNVVR